MSPIHVFSLKVGSSHGLWQYKLSGTHDRVMMHSLRHILNKTCQLLDYNYADRSAVYLFYFSAEPFEGYQVCLEKTRVVADGGCLYRIKQSNIGAFMATGVFPAIVNTNYLRSRKVVDGGHRQLRQVGNFQTPIETQSRWTFPSLTYQFEAHPAELYGSEGEVRLLFLARTDGRIPNMADECLLIDQA